MAATLTGCADTSVGTAVAADRPGLLDDLRSLAGTWIGSYQCAQGATGLTLTVQPKTKAEFAFYPLPENPTVASGTFTMNWQAESDRIVFRKSSWIDRPGSYVMVDLIADHTGSTTTLTGTVVGAGCTTFWLQRDVT
ncbi:hypothetical protein [Nocardia sp. NPDC058705]|uniref:hypothetical protein n=1 Tax=Nocardia sp. NPDC058705 TaxID=3346609 RepID=UPI0036B52895